MEKIFRTSWEIRKIRKVPTGFLGYEKRGSYGISPARAGIPVYAKRKGTPGGIPSERKKL
jgi:hypothetical protein